MHRAADSQIRLKKRFLFFCWDPLNLEAVISKAAYSQQVYP